MKVIEKLLGKMTTYSLEEQALRSKKKDVASELTEVICSYLVENEMLDKMVFSLNDKYSCPVLSLLYFSCPIAKTKFDEFATQIDWESLEYSRAPIVTYYSNYIFAIEVHDYKEIGKFVALVKDHNIKIKRNVYQDMVKTKETDNIKILSNIPTNC